MILSNKNYLMLYFSTQISQCHVNYIFWDTDCFLLVPHLRNDVIVSEARSVRICCEIAASLPMVVPRNDGISCVLAKTSSRGGTTK